MLAESVHSVADTSQPGTAAARAAPAARKPTRCTSSDTAAAGTSTRSWWRWCCSPSARYSRSTRATTRSRTRRSSPRRSWRSSSWSSQSAWRRYSFRTAVGSPAAEGSGSWWRFIRNSRNPELPVVLLEDTGALVGLVFALRRCRADDAHRRTRCGTASAPSRIGVLLGVIAVILMVEMHSLLIGEGATGEQEQAIRAALEQTDNIDRLIHLRTPVPGSRGTCWWRRKIALAPRPTWPPSPPPSMPPKRRSVRRCPPRRLSTWNQISIGRRPLSAPRFSASEQPHVVPDGAADQLHRRDHVEAVQQAEPAQKPFGQNGIGLGGAEELVEQLAHRAVPPRHRPGGPVQRRGRRSRSSSTPGTWSSRSRALNSRARSAPGDSSARRRWPACSDVIVMPCPKVGLKLATASPNGRIPAGKRSSLS